MSGLAEIRLNLLLFSVGGVHFGMDAELAAAITEYGGEQAEDLFWFHQVLGYGSDTIVYHSPAVVAIRTEDSRSFRVIIDMMEDLAEVSMLDIRPFPPLMEPIVLPKGMWGILAREGRIILLVDFQQLLRHKEGHCTKFNRGNMS